MLYYRALFFDKRVVELAKKGRPSLRNGLGITSLIELYLQQGDLEAEVPCRGFAWLDAGTFDSLIEAASFVQTIENRQGITINAPEEIAFRKGWTSREELLASAERYGKSPYGEHLKRVSDGKIRS